MYDRPSAIGDSLLASGCGVLAIAGTWLQDHIGSAPHAVIFVAGGYLLWLRIRIARRTLSKLDAEQAE